LRRRLCGRWVTWSFLFRFVIRDVVALGKGPEESSVVAKTGETGRCPSDSNICCSKRDELGGFDTIVIYPLHV